MNDRAIVYRRKYGIPAEWGTAVNVQAMVFGNTGKNQAQALDLPVILLVGKKFFMVSFLPMPKEKMS